MISHEKESAALHQHAITAIDRRARLNEELNRLEEVLGNLRSISNEQGDTENISVSVKQKRTGVFKPRWKLWKLR